MKYLLLTILFAGVARADQKSILQARLAVIEANKTLIAAQREVDKEMNLQANAQYAANQAKLDKNIADQEKKLQDQLAKVK